MNIVIADIDAKNLKSASIALQQDGVPVLALQLDVANESQWQEVAEKTIERFGKIHMVVNNAGVSGEVGPLQQQKKEGWQWTLDVNLMGVIYGSQTVLPYIKQHGEGGWIVNVASMAGMGGVPYGGAYSATKTAVVSLSEGWAMEFKQDGIDVAILCPAFVKTRIHESHRNHPDEKARINTKQQASDKVYQKSKKQVEAGIDVSIVGQRLVEALKDKELYVFTHPNYQPVLQHRAKMIDAAMQRAANSPLLREIVNQPIDML